MKIIRVSDVDDFMTGTREFELDAMPPQDELNSNQIEFIKRKTLDPLSSNMRGKYFLKYPKYAYIGFYDINAIASYDPNTAKNLFNLWVNVEEERDAPSYVTGDEIAQLVVSNWDKFNVNLLKVTDALSYEEGNSQVFTNFLKKKYPYLISSGQNAEKMFQDFLNTPSDEYYAKIKLAIDKKQIPNLPDFYRKLINSESYIKNVSGALEKTRNHRDVWEDDSESILSALNELRKSYLNSQSYEYDIFNVVISESDFGEIKNILIGNKFVDISVVENLIITLQKEEGQYWKMYTDSNNLQYDLKYENIQYDVKNNEIYLMDEDNRIFPFKIPEQFSEKFYGSSGETYLTPLFGKIERGISAKENIDTIKDWVESVKNSGKFSSEDQMYLYLVKSVQIKTITEKAGSHIFSGKIQNGNILSEEAWESQEKHDWNTHPPYFVDYAWDFWSSVPKTVIQSLGKSDISTWFLFFSGVFTPQTIRNCTYSLDELGKHIDNVISYSSEEEHNAFVESVKQELRKKQEKDVEIFEQKWPEFLKNNVKQQRISDYPDIFEYAKKIIDINLSTEDSYRKDDSIYELAYQKLLDMPINIINKQAFLNTFGESGTTYFPSPSKANGFFSSGSSLFNYKPSIVVYSGGLNNDVEDILKELGITSDSSLEINEENVLWHEIAHAIHHIVVPNRSYSLSNSDNESADEWLTSPDEIFAISYGNLAHIKKIIRQYFEKNLTNNPKITAGLLSQMKSDIINTFAFEFKGMKKEEALHVMQETMPEFNEESIEALNEISNEQKVNDLTKLFSSFFLRKFMRSKVEDAWSDILKDSSTKQIDFKEEIKIPEREKEYNPYAKDKFILDLEKRPDYQKFIEDAQNLVSKYKNKQDIKPYLHRDLQTFRNPTSLVELNLLLFGAPSLISSVDTKNFNYIFDKIVPESLRNYVKEIVDREKQLLSGQRIVEKDTPVTPDEADEAGEFISDMDEQYGADWMWLAENKSWYKFAQEQKDFNFYSEMEESHYQKSQDEVNFEDNYFKSMPKTTDLLEEILEEINEDNIEKLKLMLEQYGFEYEIINFSNGPLVTVTINNKLYVIPDISWGEVKEAQEWIWELSEEDIMEFIPPPPEEQFWDNVSGLSVYHATHPNNLKSIFKSGLEVRNESRGISNKWTPSAVFTSLTPEGTDSYGSAILEIDVGLMKEDGYMPRASLETPVEAQNAEYALANKIGLENYIPGTELSSDGISESTIVFYDSIPAKYISEYI